MRSVAEQIYLDAELYICIHYNNLADKPMLWQVAKQVFHRVKEQTWHPVGIMIRDQFEEDNDDYDIKE